ncbi:MAG: pilin [Dehalococcoidia bacterium]|nr:pilin [Dehalococcoidia bacterium]
MRGFTLIELMIAVAIIGILVAVGFPQYQNYVARAQVAEALVLASGAKTAVAEYFNTTGDFPADNKAAGLPEDPKDINGKYVDSVRILSDDGLMSIQVVISSDAHTKIADGFFDLLPTIHEGSISWTCYGDEFAELDGLPDLTSYLPSSCTDH